MKKTRRKWNPNVQYQKLYSEILDESIKFKVTTSALRSIDKAGGLDNYLLTSKHVINNKSVGGNKGQQGMGQQVRNRIMQKLQHQKKLKREAVARGENVDDWDKIILIGKKIKSSQQLQGVVEEDNVATASS
jgi:large subunit ribosomal protein L28